MDSLKASCEQEASFDAAPLSAEGSTTFDAKAAQSIAALVLPLRVLALVAVVAVLVIGESVFIPFALAVLISFALRPIVRALQTLAGVPAPLSAFALTSVLAAILVAGLYSLSQPAQEWLQDAPHALRALQRQASAVRGPLEDMRETTAVITELGGGGSDEPASVVVSTGGAVEESVVSKTSEGFAYTVATMITLFFILGWGDRFFRHVIALIPRFRDRRGAVEVAHAIEVAIGRYLLTITAINVCLGAGVALLCHLLALPNPLLWGVVATLLNFMPYIGAAITTGVLFAVSLVASSPEHSVIVAPLIFLVMTTFEGYLITPYAVGRSLTLNPLVIFFSLVLCFFLWGGIGALLAVPILVSIKVALEGSGGSGTLVAQVLS